MRYRTKDDRSELTYTVIGNGWGCNPSHHQETTTSLGNIQGLLSTMRDVVTPSYHLRRRRGDVIINPMTKTESEFYCSFDGPDTGYYCAPPSTAQNYTERHGPHFYTQSGANVVPKTLLTNDEVNDLLTVAATKAWADTVKSEAQILVFLAELKKTFSLLQKPLGNAHRFLDYVKNHKARQSVTARNLTLAQYIAREWLTFRYGWLQLKRDIESIARALGKDKRTGLVASYGTAKAERKENSSSTISYSIFDVDVEDVFTDSLIVRAGIFNSADLGVEDFFGISIPEALSTIWEVIPYSFVVDWVVNVQGYLIGLIPSAITPIKGKYQVLDRVKTVVRTPVSTSLKSGTDPNYSISQDVVGNLVRRERVKTRLPTLPDPGLRLNIKISDIADKRVLDAIALVILRLNKP